MPHRKSTDSPFSNVRPILVHNRTPSVSLNAPYHPSRTENNDDNVSRTSDAGTRGDGSVRSRSAYPQSPYADGGNSRMDYSRAERVGIPAGNRGESEHSHAEPSSNRSLRNSNEVSFKHMAESSAGSQRRSSAVNGRSDGGRTAGRRKSTDSMHENADAHVSQSKEQGVPLTVKIAVLGDTETGKTSLVRELVSDNAEVPSTASSSHSPSSSPPSSSPPSSSSPSSPSFSEVYCPTVNLQCKHRMVHISGTDSICLSFWELSGDSRFYSSIPLACSDANMIFLCFDLTRPATLQSVKKWYEDCRQWNQRAMLILVGTKFDLLDKQGSIERTKDVSKQAVVYAKAIGCPLIFSSSALSVNTHRLLRLGLCKLFDLPSSLEASSVPGEPIFLPDPLSVF